MIFKGGRRRGSEEEREKLHREQMNTGGQGVRETTNTLGCRITSTFNDRSSKVLLITFGSFKCPISLSCVRKVFKIGSVLE